MSTLSVIVLSYIAGTVVTALVILKIVDREVDNLVKDIKNLTKCR